MIQTFQYKVIHNILYLKEMLYRFGKKLLLCSFRNSYEEPPFYAFHKFAKQSTTQLILFWLQSTKETLEKGMKYIQRYETQNVVHAFFYKQ